MTASTGLSRLAGQTRAILLRIIFGFAVLAVGVVLAVGLLAMVLVVIQ